MVALASFLPLLASFKSKKPAAHSYAVSGCDISSASISSELPASQTVLVAPSTSPDFIGLGVGVQNYTCAAAGTYTSARFITAALLYLTLFIIPTATSAPSLSSSTSPASTARPSSAPSPRTRTRRGRSSPRSSRPSTSSASSTATRSSSVSTTSSSTPSPAPAPAPSGKPPPPSLS